MIDRKAAAADVRPPPPLVFRRHGSRADVAAAAEGLARDLGDGDGVPQAEIEALGADRRKHMGGLADQGDAAARPRLGGRRPSSGKAPWPGSTSTLPRIEWQRRSISASSAAPLSRARRSASAGATTQTMLDRRPGQRHDRERAVLRYGIPSKYHDEAGSGSECR